MAKIWLEIVVNQPFMSRKFDAPPSTMRRVFVRFLEEIEDTKKTF